MITYPTDQLILINLVNQLIGAAPHYLRLPHKRFLKHFTQADLFKTDLFKYLKRSTLNGCITWFVSVAL